MLVHQARSTTFKVQVNFVSYGIEYRRSCDSTDILNKEKSNVSEKLFSPKLVEKRLTENCKNYMPSVLNMSST